LLWLIPRSALVLIVIWILLVAVTKVASNGSLAALVLALPAAWIEEVSWGAMAWLAAVVFLVLYRHRGNIARLFGSGEHKVMS
jgi:glycerol-3-phosphate acyltransferase PlsY